MMPARYRILSRRSRDDDEEATTTEDDTEATTDYPRVDLNEDTDKSRGSRAPSLAWGICRFDRTRLSHAGSRVAVVLHTVVATVRIDSWHDTPRAHQSIR